MHLGLSQDPAGLRVLRSEGGRQQVFGLGIVFRTRHGRLPSLVRRCSAGFLRESHSPALAGSWPLPSVSLPRLGPSYAGL
jgi:hypothetical protein